MVMYSHFYLRKSIVYVPTMGIMEKGFYRGIEPVAVVSVTNTGAFCPGLVEVGGKSQIVRGRIFGHAGGDTAHVGMYWYARFCPRDLYQWDAPVTRRKHDS